MPTTDPTTPRQRGVSPAAAAALEAARGLVDVRLDELPVDARAAWATMARPILAELVGAGGEVVELAGERAHSVIVLRVDVVHDGPGRLLGEHLAVEVEQVLARWGNDVDDVRVDDVEVVHPGDRVSRSLPVIGSAHEARPCTGGEA